MTDSNSLGGSYPLLFDAFNINPSALPSFQTPVGVELFWEEGKSNFAFIKGHGRIGSGLTVFTTDAQFFSNVNNRDLMNTSYAKSIGLNTANERYDPKVNFGNSLNIFGEQSGSAFSLNLGYGLKLNRVTKEIEKQVGIVLKSKFCNLSYAYSAEARNAVLMTWTLGLRIGDFIYDYTRFDNTSGLRNITDIHSLIFKLKKLSVTGAYRRQQDPTMTEQTKNLYSSWGMSYQSVHYLLGVNYSFNDHFRIGYYSNYVLNEKSSFVFQYIF